MTVWIYYFLLILLLAISAGAIIFGIPGVWMMMAAALAYAWVTHFRFLASHGLYALLALAVLSEIVEFLAAGVAAKSAGGSTRASLGAIVGAFVGGIAGTFVIPVIVIGTLIGVVAGAFVGSLMMEQTRNSDANHLLRVGFAAAKGRLLGTLLKLLFASVMFVVALVLAFP